MEYTFHNVNFPIQTRSYSRFKASSVLRFQTAEKHLSPTDSSSGISRNFSCCASFSQSNNKTERKFKRENEKKRGENCTFTKCKAKTKIKRSSTDLYYRSYSFQYLKYFFNLSEEEAASRLEISKSALNRIKKELNIKKWPYRVLQSLEKTRTKLQNQEEKQAIPDNTSLSEEITKVDLAISFIQNNPNIILKYNSKEIELIASRFERVKINNLLNM
ncbi:hypothetical protein ABK040_012378 [Willaertia magna]